MGRWWLLIAALVGVSVGQVIVESQEGEVMEIGTEKQLLFDDALFVRKEGFVTTMNPAIRTEEAVLLPEEPWEAHRIWWHCSVLREEDRTFKLWYDAYGEDDRCRLCLAISEDGVHWTRPKLGVCEYKGSKENNIVNDEASREMGTVFKDPSAPPEERYKFIFSGGKLKKAEGVPGYSGIRGAYSADGIHWSAYQAERIIPWYTDTQNVAFWDERIEKYVAFVRWDEGYRYEDDTVVGKFLYRCIGRTESKDFTNFPPPQKVLEPPPEPRSLKENPGWMDLYNSAAVKYPYAANAYFLFPSAFYHYGMANKLDVRLAVSRDGVNFALLPGTFVRLGQSGAFDSERIYMAVGTVRVGDEIWMYYQGCNLDHSGKWKPYPPKFGGIGRVRLRLDGFVSQDAPASGGMILTKAFVVRGNRMVLNMDASAGGHLAIEFLDEKGEGIERFSGDRSSPIVGNGVRNVAHMRNRQYDFSPLVGRRVQMRIIGRNVKFYAFQFVDAGELEGQGGRKE